MSPLLLLLPFAAASQWTTPFPAGTYALRLQTATVAKVPVLGRTQGGSVAWMIGELAEDGGRSWNWRTCALDIQGVTGRARVGVSPTFIAAIRRMQLDAQVEPAPGGWSFALDMGEAHVGYDPGATDTLPQDIGDPAITDWDQDGRPAATVNLHVPVLGAVELYVAQRAHIQLAGRTDAATGVTQGTVQFTRFEQRTLGASHRIFDSNPEMWPDPARSGFELRPLPGGADCADVRAGFSGG